LNNFHNLLTEIFDGFAILWLHLVDNISIKAFVSDTNGWYLAF